MAENLKASQGSNLNQWSNAIANINPEIANIIGESRLKGFEALDVLGLPRYERVSLPLPEFMEDPGPVLDRLGSELFYIVAQPFGDFSKRISKSGLHKREAVDFFKYHIPPEEQSSYQAVIQQYFKNLYGGNIIINKNGHIYGEFKLGKQGPISKGTVPPEYYLKRDKYRGIFQYSFEDPVLRQSIYSTLQHIPHYGSGRHKVYRPGYYEFVLVDKTSEGLMSPIFLDYRSGKIFELPD